MPAYNAERTLERTVTEIDRNVIDDVLLVDDGSSDNTILLAQKLNVRIFRHDRNYGYGRNQKTCYTEALKLGPDIVIMLHPDYQYTPRLLVAMASMVACGEYDAVLASRILGGTARAGGMPLYKYIFNRMLTFAQNLLLGSKLSEFHTGYRAYSADVLRRIPFLKNSDDFVFDNQVIVQILLQNLRIGEISCPTRYFPDASSINFVRSVRYGLGVLWTSVQFFLNRRLSITFRIFEASPETAATTSYYSALPQAKEGAG
jgi:glycosyltransferase involved in cell wall biosynthesis